MMGAVQRLFIPLEVKRVILERVLSGEASSRVRYEGRMISKKQLRAWAEKLKLPVKELKGKTRSVELLQRQLDRLRGRVEELELLQNANNLSAPGTRDTST